MVPRQQFKHCFDDRGNFKALAFTDTQPIGRTAAPSHAFIVERVIRTICENFISYLSMTLTVMFRFMGRYTVFYNWKLPLRLPSGGRSSVGDSRAEGDVNYKVRDRNDGVIELCLRSA